MNLNRTWTGIDKDHPAIKASGEPLDPKMRSGQMASTEHAWYPFHFLIIMLVHECQLLHDIAMNKQEFQYQF
jgi:hypothetical protein